MDLSFHYFYNDTLAPVIASFVLLECLFLLLTFCVAHHLMMNFMCDAGLTCTVAWPACPVVGPSLHFCSWLQQLALPMPVTLTALQSSFLVPW